MYCPFGKKETGNDGKRSLCRCDVAKECIQESLPIKAYPGIKIGRKILTKKDELEIAYYSMYLCKLATTKSSDIFSNGDENHAKVVLTEFLHSARKNVKIYCSEDDLLVFSKTFHDFLRDSGDIHVEILLENHSHSVDDLLRDLQNGHVCIKTNTPESKRQIQYEIGQNGSHFMIVDDSAYRYEYDTAKHAAICSFDDKQQSKQLSSAFNRAFNLSSGL
jgi:hypothetical protein